jgi:hypothetical protein
MMNSISIVIKLYGALTLITMIEEVVFMHIMCKIIEEILKLFNWILKTVQTGIKPTT